MKRILAVLLVAPLSLPAAAPPNDASALYQLGRDALTRGEPEKAAKYLKKAVALKPNDARYHYQLGNAHFQASRSAFVFPAISLANKSKAAFERAVQLDPDFLPARFALLEFHMVALVGSSEKAALEQAAEIRKRDAIDGHRAYARIYWDSNKSKLARKEYADMIRAHPASARAHYFFGVHQMLRERNYKSARDAFEAARKLDPAYMPAYFQIGQVAARAGNNFARGEEALKKYLAYRPKDDEPSAARAHYWLGALYEKQGKKSEAKASYSASLKINPNQEDAADAMKRVS
jgi:tetratricopeptide (TPR) repeat protein